MQRRLPIPRIPDKRSVCHKRSLFAPFGPFALAQRVKCGYVAGVVEGGGFGLKRDLESGGVFGDRLLVEEVIDDFDGLPQGKRPPPAGDGVRAEELPGREEHVALVVVEMDASVTRDAAQDGRRNVILLSRVCA